jgi:nicotinate dehydrogenase subunit A
MTIVLNINDKPQAIDADPSTPLLYVLRNELALHGPRFGCGLGQCGACTVHLDGRPTFSCILPIAAVGERKIITLEGLLEGGKPNKLQQAFIDEQAAQCGYCISGMVMRAQALLRANPSPTDGEIRKYMRPNLCRCGTHAAILRAIKRAAATQEKRS